MKFKVIKTRRKNKKPVYSLYAKRNLREALRMLHDASAIGVIITLPIVAIFVIIHLWYMHEEDFESLDDAKKYADRIDVYEIVEKSEIKLDKDHNEIINEKII